MSKLRLAGLGSNLMALLFVFLYSISDHPDRVAFLFGAVMYVVNGAAVRVISHVNEAAK